MTERQSSAPAIGVAQALEEMEIAWPASRECRRPKLARASPAYGAVFVADDNSDPVRALEPARAAARSGRGALMLRPLTPATACDSKQWPRLAPGRRLMAAACGGEGRHRRVTSEHALRCGGGVARIVALMRRQRQSKFAHRRLALRRRNKLSARRPTIMLIKLKSSSS